MPAAANKPWAIDFSAGFSPDLDTRTPGIIVDCSQLYPTPAGYRPLKQPFAATTATMSQSPVGSFFMEYSDLTDVYIFGTPNKLLQLDPRHFTAGFQDISGNQVFNASTTNRWRFASFGNDIIAVNGVDQPQIITKSSNVAPPPANPATPIAGAPIGSIVESAGDFVFIFSGNTWNNCAIGNDRGWTPSLSTQAANGVLGDTPGPITAAKHLGQNNILVYKNHATYLGTFLGPPIGWSFTLLSNEAGCLNQESLIDHDGLQVMIGSGQMYSCDGSPPQSLNPPLRRWFFEGAPGAIQSFIAFDGYPIGCWDKFHDVSYWFYSSSIPSGTQSRYICWHKPSNRWMTGFFNNPVSDIVRPYARVNSLGAITPPTQHLFDTPFPYYGLAIVMSRNLFGFSGATAPAYLVTGDLGDPVQYTQVNKVVPAFTSYPSEPPPTGQPGSTGATCTPLIRQFLGGPQIADPEAQLNQDGFWPVRSNGRYHALRIGILADSEIAGAQLDYELTGVR